MALTESMTSRTYIPYQRYIEAVDALSALYQTGQHTDRRAMATARGRVTRTWSAYERVARKLGVRV